MQKINNIEKKDEQDYVSDKDGANKYPLSKFEYDLYHDEDHIIQPIIRVKYIGTSNKVEKWKIMDNTKVIFVVEGNKLTKKEKNFLRTIDGVNFLIKQFKSGVKSFNFLKKELKTAVK